MSTNLSAGRAPSDRPDGAGRRVALVCSRFNDLIVGRLERGARQALIDHGVSDDDIVTWWVPGALEVPQVAKAVAEVGGVDAIVALGTVIRGDTYHFEIVADASAAGLMQLSLTGDVVITNGILTVDNEHQALERCGPGAGNKGAEAAIAALEVCSVLTSLRRR